MGLQKRILEAEAFIVRDSQGHKRAFFGMQGEEPVLALYDSEGQARVVARVTSESSGGSLPDDAAGGLVRLPLTAGSEAIALFNREGKPHLIILGMTDGTSFYIYDSKGEVKIRLDARESGSAVSLHDGGPKGLFEYSRKEGGCLTLSDERGEPAVSLDTKHSGSR